MNFSAITLPELAPIFTIFGAMLLGFYGITKVLLKMFEKMSEKDREERQELAKAISEMAAGMQKVAESNIRIADESEKRNGHLAEISVENKDQILGAINNLTIKQQTVHQQTVEHETVINKESK